MPRKTIATAFVGLVFAAAAGVGLAQITTATGSAADETSSTTGTQSTAPRTITAPPATSVPTTIPPSTSTVPPMTSTAPQTETGTGQQKVVICHHTGSRSNPQHTITVAAPAVPAHLANHHDTIGPCPPVTTSVTTRTTTPTTTTLSTARHVKKPKHKSNGHASNRGHHGSTTTRGKSHNAGHGNSSGSHGNSGGSHGNSGGSHGNSGGSHGNSGNGHGK